MKNIITVIFKCHDDLVYLMKNSGTNQNITKQRTLVNIHISGNFHGDGCFVTVERAYLHLHFVRFLCLKFFLCISAHFIKINQTFQFAYFSFDNQCEHDVRKI